MNKNTRKKASAIGLALSLALGGSSSAHSQNPASSAAAAECDQMTSRISQLMADGDALVAEHRPDQALHGMDASAPINRFANLAIAEIESSEANTLARTEESMRCRSGAGAETCDQTRARISELTADADRIIAENRSEQSLHDASALLNRIGSTEIAQKDANDANTLAILSRTRNCSSNSSPSECGNSDASTVHLTEDSDNLVSRNRTDQSMPQRIYLLFVRVRDPSGVVNRAADLNIAQSEAEEANTAAIRGAGRCE